MDPQPKLGTQHNHHLNQKDAECMTHPALHIVGPLLDEPLGLLTQNIEKEGEDIERNCALYHLEEVVLVYYF